MNDLTDSGIMLMKIGFMPDLITWLNLRVFGGQYLCLFKSKRTQRPYLIPLQVFLSQQNINVNWDDFELSQVILSHELR